MTDRSRRSPPASLRLHHFGQAVPEIAPAAARLCDRFGYTAATPIIHDTRQTAFVQFLRLPDEPCYLELVAPDSQHSKLVNAVKRGGALHHVCYMAGALEAEVARLEESRMRLISEPKPASAFQSRRICWLMGEDQVLIELLEHHGPDDLCIPGL